MTLNGLTRSGLIRSSGRIRSSGPIRFGLPQKSGGLLLIGRWNRHDSRLVECTRDHKPEIPEEKARIEATGDPPGEVREVSPEHFRIFIKGEEFPGITMSRAFGDFACAERGVSQLVSVSLAEAVDILDQNVA